MNAPHLVSIQVGAPRQYGVEGASHPDERPWLSAIVKEPVEGAVWLGRTNLAGDRQADLKNHGGSDKALLAYAAGHYPLWRRELSRPELPHGAFGENLTIAGLTEETVCLGDTFAIGEVRVQVSQPRRPCWKLARRWGIKDLTARVQASGRTGWYLRVLGEGYVWSGLPVVLLERPYPSWTVARATYVMYHWQSEREAAAELAACPLLAAVWRETLSLRLAGGEQA